MRTVKTFAYLADAGFAVSLLEAAGIRAVLIDEQSFLSAYGMATGGIRLQVEDEDYERALQVLEKGPDAAGAPEPKVTEQVHGTDERIEIGRNVPVGLFMLAAVALGVLIFVGRSKNWPQGEQTYEFDYNGDGRTDAFWTYREELPVRGTEDRNFDGRPDLWFSFRHGLTDSAKSDTDFNGVADRFAEYVHGIPAREDVRPNDSAVVVRRYIYEHGVLREEWVDEDADGRFDFHLVYDPFGKPSEPIRK